MQFIDVESIAFGTIYRENARDQQIIGDQCVPLIKDFITNYGHDRRQQGEGHGARMITIEIKSLNIPEGY
jgi:hypothetical protein